MENQRIKAIGMSESPSAGTVTRMKESKPAAKIVAADEIATPEKPTQLPWRSRVAFSVKEVKEAALGLQKPHKDSAGRRCEVLKGSVERGDDDGDLLAVEEELRSASPSPDLLRESAKNRSPLKKLPDRYEILMEFFNSMECSIRLLRLKRLIPTFANICSSIQHLTGRRFTYGNLAQLKYILPEAISIKKVLLRDEATCCMKPELQVYLQSGTIESTLKRRDESGYSILRRLFRQRILNFSREHPELPDIPEDELPHPFGHQTKPNMPSNVASVSACSTPPTDSTADTQQFTAMASHIQISFQKRFSQKSRIPDAEKTPLTCFNKVSTKDDSHVPIVASPIKCTSKPAICKKPIFASPRKHSNTHVSGKEGKKVIDNDTCCPQKLNCVDGTPARLLTPSRLMTATPEIQTPKRLRPTTVYDTPVKQPERQSARTKLLFSTPQKSSNTEDLEDVTVIVSDDDDDDVINILPETLLQEIREKERRAEEEKGNCVAQARRRKEMVASLPRLFDMILLIFQSRKRSHITKQELVHKIISCYCSIVDGSEVEQQLKLLQELAPDWISAKMVSTGDFLYSVNKISNPQEVRQRLAEAK